MTKHTQVVIHAYSPASIYDVEMEMQSGNQIIVKEQNWLYFHFRLAVDGVCML